MMEVYFHRASVKMDEKAHHRHQSTDPSCSALDPFNYSFPLEAGRLPSELPGISPAPSPSLGANARSLELLGSSKTGFASGMTLSNKLIVKSNTSTYSYYVFYMHAIGTEIIYFSSVTISSLLLALFFFFLYLSSEELLKTTLPFAEYTLTAFDYLL